MLKSETSSLILYKIYSIKQEKCNTFTAFLAILSNNLFNKSIFDSFPFSITYHIPPEVTIKSGIFILPFMAYTEEGKLVVILPYTFHSLST